MNTWAARNSSSSENIIFSEVKCGPWNAKVETVDRKMQFEVKTAKLPSIGIGIDFGLVKGHVMKNTL